MKLSLIEKKAFLGVFVVSLIFLISIFIIGRKNLWFENKNTYTTVVSSADGLSVGSLVTLSGLRVGEVSALEVDSNNKILVHFTVKESLTEKMHSGTIAKVIRSFVIGEKKINLIPGPPDNPLLKNGAMVEGEDSTEITDLISGEKIGQILKRLEGLTQGLDRWSEGLAKGMAKMNPEDLTAIYQKMNPTMDNLNLLAQDGRKLVREVRQQIFKEEKIGKVLTNTNKVLAPLAQREQLMEHVLDNLQVISDELKANPKFTSKIISTLKEVEITLKAIQKTWILEDHVKGD
jgi:phospholipid/cholesterol/gamma-HCH transport system substrate-binding protein